jgi:hypothetical protein
MKHKFDISETVVDWTIPEIPPRRVPIGYPGRQPSSNDLPAVG